MMDARMLKVARPTKPQYEMKFQLENETVLVFDKLFDYLKIDLDQIK